GSGEGGDDRHTPQEYLIGERCVIPQIRITHLSPNISYLVRNSKPEQLAGVAAADEVLVLRRKPRDAVHGCERIVETHVEAVIAAERHAVGADQAHEGRVDAVIVADGVVRETPQIGA